MMILPQCKFEGLISDNNNYKDVCYLVLVMSYEFTFIYIDYYPVFLVLYHLICYRRHTHLNRLNYIRSTISFKLVRVIMLAESSLRYMIILIKIHPQAACLVWRSIK